MKELIEKMNAIVENAKKENRSLTDAEKAEFETIEKQIDTLKAEKRANEMKAELRAMEVTAPVAPEGIRALAQAMKEKRAITLNGTGAVNVIQQIAVAALENNSLTKGYSLFYGENAKTAIPVFSPTPATPAGVDEDEDSVSADATAVYGATDLIPKPFVSLLPVSHSTVLFNPNFESQLVGVFSKVYADAILKQSLVGTGTNQFTGVFKATGKEVLCAAAGAPTAADLLNLAIEAQGKLTNPVIVICSTFLSAIINDSSTKDPIISEILLNKTIFGMPFTISSYAPKTSAEGDVVAVAFSKPNYAVAIASEILVTPIRKAGDTNIYYQAEMYLNGKPIVAGDVFQLTAI